MLHPQSGERILLTGETGYRITIKGRHAERLAAVAVSAQGKVVPFEAAGDNAWQLPSLGDVGETAELLLYVVDDRTGGFVNESYPVIAHFNGADHELPAPAEQLAAVILSELYPRNGERRLKISNEGYTFGIDAYARARGLADDLLPQRRRSSEAEPGPGRSRAPGQTMGSGSGVIVAPGLVVTNAHVIDGGSQFHVGRDRQRLNPIAVDPLHDLALLQGEVEGDVIPLRIAAALWLGEAILAAGYPLMDVLGADLKVSTGNVSGLKGGEGDVSRFQFTAPIGSGSSGGAVLDEYGNLIGITAASLAHANIRDRGAISENVNFGVKVSLVHEMMAASGIDIPEVALWQDNGRREVVRRLRRSVVSIIVGA